MNGRAPDLHRDDGVQTADSSLKRLQVGILVRKDAKLRCFVDAESNTRRYIGLVRAEPGITLRLAEKPVEEGVVAVVVHGRKGDGRGEDETRKRNFGCT